MSDLAQHFLLKAGISAIRRLRKSDMNRVARAVGGQIVHRTEELKESDVGTECGLFEVYNEKFVQIFYVTCTCIILLTSVTSVRFIDPLSGHQSS